jgi:hypothetical protein
MYSDIAGGFCSSPPPTSESRARYSAPESFLLPCSYPTTPHDRSD